MDRINSVSDRPSCLHSHRGLWRSQKAPIAAQSGLQDHSDGSQMRLTRKNPKSCYQRPCRANSLPVITQPRCTADVRVRAAKEDKGTQAPVRPWREQSFEARSFGWPRSACGEKLCQRVLLCLTKQAPPRATSDSIQRTTFGLQVCLSLYCQRTEPFTVGQRGWCISRFPRRTVPVDHKA